MQRDIVCLISAVDDILQYKQKFRLVSVATLADVQQQLATFLKSLGVTERVGVELFDSVNQSWSPLEAIESCPDKARLRIRRVSQPYEPLPTRTANTKEKASRQKGDLSYINGKKRIWSGTRWNCEHDRRLSECKFCAANKYNESNLQRQTSDILPMTNYQKRRRLGNYDQPNSWGRQTSLPDVSVLNRMERRPLQLNHSATNNEDIAWYSHSETSAPRPAASSTRPESSCGTANEKPTPLLEEEDWFWDLVDLVEPPIASTPP